MATMMAQAFHPGAKLPAWDGHRGYLEYLDTRPPAVNVAALAGHGTIRAQVMGFDERPATDAESDAMAAIVDEAMGAGCVGMSSGLTYPPGTAATTDELVALARVVGAAGGRYTSHIRDEGDGLLEAVDEAILIGARAGVGVVVSHLKAYGRPNWGKVAAALARIDAAGDAVACDQYPYTASSTLLAVTAPRIATGLLGVDDIVIATTAQHPEWHGHSLARLAEDLGVGVDDIAGHVLASEPAATVIAHAMSERDVRTIITHADVMVGSDGIPSLEGHPHPRLYGTFARVLGTYVRDEGLVDLPAMIHRMTQVPATVFDLSGRGVIAPGSFADLVLFDADRIADVATYDDPQRFPEGIEGVWVNGVSTVEASGHTGATAGRALRRGQRD